MLTTEENDFLTRVGPGTPCGEMMRRYWHPIAATAMLDENPVRPVRILGEDVTLYRDRQGRLGLIGQRCPHRAVDMQFGIPENEGLRCPYHGWMFDETGRCIEQPLEPPDSTFKEKVTTKAYKVEELGGLIWGYLGPAPAPLVPRWDLLVKEGCFRQILASTLPCNWLQVMENRADNAHGVYLHGRFFQYVLERQGRLTNDPTQRANASMRNRPVKHRYAPHPYGFVKQVLMAGETEENSPTWNIGINPALFPYTLRFGSANTMRNQLQIGVPIDDTTTWHVTYDCYLPPPGVAAPPQTSSIPYADVPLKDESGEWVLDCVLSQDMAAWWSQGPITDRSVEHLATTDVVVIGYRNLLKEQIETVLRGGEPINVFRNAEKNQLIEFELAPPRRTGGQFRNMYHLGSYINDDQERYSPDLDVIKDLMRQAAELAEKT